MARKALTTSADNPFRTGALTKKEKKLRTLKFFDILPRAEIVDFLRKTEANNALLLADMLEDPAYLDRLPTTLMSQAEISLSSLADLYEKSQGMEGRMKMLKHVPEIFEDVAIDAKSSVVPCPYCDAGITHDKDGNERTCAQCYGEGALRRTGDSDARKTVFETLGFTGKKAPLIAIQNNTINPGVQSFFTDLVNKTQKAIEGSKIIEGEIVK